MAVVITITNEKGGVSKTTTTRHLAYFLAQAKKRVLVIDNDPQASLTRYYGFQPDEITAGGHGALDQAYTEEKSIEEIIIPIDVYENLAPGSRGLASVGPALDKSGDSEGALLWALKSVQDQFDVILIDNGPTLDKLCLNALTASNYVLIPTKTDMLSMDGIGKLANTVRIVQRRKPDLKILGVVPTIYHRGRVADDQALAALREAGHAQGIRIFDPIPAATAYDRAFPEAKPVFELDPNAAGRIEYQRLADVIIEL